MKNIFSHLKSFKNKVVAIDNEGDYITYKNLFVTPHKLFEQIDFKKKLVAITSDNSIDFLKTYVFCLYKNIPLILLDSNTQKSEIMELTKKFKINLLISKNNYNLNKKFLKKKISYKKVSFYLFKQENLILKKGASLILSTSGTSGLKKFVVLSQKNLINNTRNICNALNINHQDKTITTLSPSYSYGMSIINTHLYKGATILLNKNSLISKNFWDFYLKFRPNNFGVVPYMIKILEKINYGGLNLYPPKYISQAGGKLDLLSKKKLIKYAKKNNIRLFFMYGQTEASPRITVLPHQLVRKYSNSVGYPIGDNKVFIKNKNNELVNHGRGEIVCKGKNIFLGYAKNFNDLNNLKETKYLYTGDLGEKTPKGLIYVIGRQKKIIKLFGLRIEIAILEKILRGKKIDCIVSGGNEMIKVETNKSNFKKKKKIIEVIKKETKIPSNFIKVLCVNKLVRNKDKKLGL